MDFLFMGTLATTKDYIPITATVDVLCYQPLNITTI